MSNLNWALITLFVFCLLMFAFVHVALPRIKIIKLTSTKLSYKLAEKVFIIALISFFIFFIGIFLATNNDLFFILLSQLMTLKISKGFGLYQDWLAEPKNTHNWKQLFLYMLFYIVKPK